MSGGIDTTIRGIGKLMAAAVLCLLVAACGGGSKAKTATTDPGNPTGSLGTAAANKSKSTFTAGYTKFEQATNLLGSEIAPLEGDVTASAGNASRMSEAFITLGKTEGGLAATWHRALVAFEALKAPPRLAGAFAATAADATKVYRSLETISRVAPASAKTLTASQFVAGGKDLSAFATRARALAADLGHFNQRLGIH
jgi:hypothetical protein